LTPAQLELLPLWFNAAFELPLAASNFGPAMGYEEVVQSLTNLTVTKAIATNNNAAVVLLKVEKNNYTQGPLWIARILKDTEFDAERLKTVAKRILNEIPNIKRSGRTLMEMGLAAMNFTDECPSACGNAFRLEQTLQPLVESDAAMADARKTLEAIKSELLTRPGGVFARIAGDLNTLGNVFEPWKLEPFCGAPDPVPAALPALSRDLFAHDALRPRAGCTGGCMITSSAEESNYWKIQCACITDPRAPDLAALLVAIEYICALEGPFWRKIRGKGLAYSYGLRSSLETGTIVFDLYKANSPLAAFNMAKDIISKFCSENASEKEADPQAADEDEDDEIEWDPSALEGAQSGVLFELIAQVETLPGALGENWTNTVLRKPLDQLDWLLKEVQKVTVETAKAALCKHVLPLFTGSKGRTVSIICPAQKKDEMREGLVKLEPPFRLAHIDVDDLVKTLAPSNGYQMLRKKAEEEIQAQA
jgi:hypothetical protein